MSGKISGLVLFAVALAAMLAGAQVVALVAAIAGVLFLFYSFGAGAGGSGSRRSSDGVWVDGGSTYSGDNSSQCDADSSSGDCGGGDGGGGGD